MHTAHLHRIGRPAKFFVEGLDEILTVNRLRLLPKLRRLLACTNAIENMQGTIRRVARNVKRWRHTSMALLWVAPHDGGTGRIPSTESPPAICRLSHGTRRCERPHVTSNLPDDDFLLRAMSRRPAASFNFRPPDIAHFFA
jgi:hypothetical protein